MTQMVPVEKKISTVRALLERSRGQIELALPRGYLTADRLLRVTMTSVQRTPKLLDCDPISLIGAVIEAAQLGLEPDGVLGMAYLAPRNIKGQQRVVLMVGYRGLIALAWRSGQVTGVSARVVHAGDEFDYAFGLEERLHHRPARRHDPSDPLAGEPIAVYGIVRLRAAGPPLWDVMTVDEIEAHRKQYVRASDDNAWTTAWPEMAKKTLLRRVLKYAPASVEVQRAISLDERGEAGLPQELELVPENVEPTTPKGKLEALTESLAATASTPEVA